MPTYYDHGLGIDTTSQITSSGDELAAAANYIKPENVDFGYFTWENQPISKIVARKLRDEDFPQLSSSLIYITIPSGSPHNIYDSTDTVLVSGNAQENNDRDFTLYYTLRGATTDTGNLAENNVWSFTTATLDFGNTEVVVGINSDIGTRNTDNVIISRTPTLNPVITVTTPTTAPTATTIYDEMDIGGTAVDPNSLPIQRVDYTATASGDDVYTQYFGVTYWGCLGNCTWTGTVFKESGPGMSIAPQTGSWYVGQRWEYIRVTVDSSYTFRLNDNTGTTIVNLSVTPGVNTLPITWLGNDLGPSESPSWEGRISNASGEISNIEFGSAGVGTDEGAKATGTDNWNFTVPLILGDTTVDVTGSNSYNLSGSDSIVVTRTEPLNPILTIITETSATTASEITIEGTASDPNGLNIVSVSYELSGARTDSGVATGTTTWTFTEGLSAGDNRFDVTAINDWTPPLSGSDSLIVTYSPPALVIFQDDEFNDSSIDPIWIQEFGVGGAVNESGTTLRLDSGEENITAGGTADFNWLYQDDIQGDFDVAIRVMDIDGSHSTGQILGLVAYIDNNNWAAIGVRYQSSTKQHHTCHRVDGSYQQTFGAAVGSYPQYWRVKRVDSTFSTYYSDDGSSWTPYDPVAGVLSDTNNVKIGLFANDQYTNTIEVYFDRVYNYVVAEDLVVVPDGDIISQWGTGGAGTGRWDRINSGVETPDDTNYIYGTDGDVQRFTMEAPSYSGASTRIRVYARGYDSFGYGLTAEIYDGAVKLGDSDVGYWTGSWSNKYGDWLTVAKTAAELADLEIKLTGQNSSGETYISELEIEIEK